MVGRMKTLSSVLVWLGTWGVILLAASLLVAAAWILIGGAKP